jgi:O-succinylbenzoic acid--CoA ligase
MQYQIQHKTYTLQQLKDYCIFILSKNDIPEWEREIWLFIQFFIDDSKDTFINKTSGSTGSAKEITIYKKYAIASANKTNSFFQLQKNNSIHLCMHAKYIGAKMMIVRALVGEMQLTYSEPKIDALYHLKDDIDFCACVPLQLITLLELNKEGNKNIKNLIIGGGAVDEKIKSKLLNHSTLYFQTFGMTETISHIALLNISKAEKAYTVLPNTSISKNDKDCLVIDAPDIGVKQLTTNDIVDIIHPNQFLWKGRIDNVINTGGVKINPEQVEAKLESYIDFPFFISSIPDEKLGNKIILIIESTSDINKENLMTMITNKVEKYESPKDIFVLNTFIYTETKKIKRKETLALLHN